MKKILYLECNSGISGDMTVGALLDLGADREVLLKALESLNVDGYHLQFGRTKKNGIDAFDFHVHLDDEHNHVGHDHSHGDDQTHSHDHSQDDDPTYSHDHSHGEDQTHNHDQSHDHDHTHSHEHSHNHDQPHSHEHSHDDYHSHDANHTHTHIHRNIQDINEIIDRLDSGDNVKNMAKRMFDIVAVAESKAHAIPLHEVHFHEVGAIDSIVDIISTAVCMDNLGLTEVVVSPLAEGFGTVRCQHGVIPVPVPATVNIASEYGLKLRFTDNNGEMVTPTGAAIAAGLRSRMDLPDSFQVLKIGMGAGKKDFKQANILRAMILLEEEPEEKMWVLEANIDDCSGEMLGFSMESLLEAGASDVWNTPIYMKKSRPAYMISVLCKDHMIKVMEDLLFLQTTTIGVRRHSVERTILDRENKVVETEWGEVEVKVCVWKDRSFCYPEYESVRKICKQTRIDFQTVYDKVRQISNRS
jgi:uncharacterized protein (TIGR00299 family) protein